MRTVRLVVATLSLVACSCPEGRAETGLGEPVRLQVPVTFAVDLDPGSYWFRFSLHRTADASGPDSLAWNEAMSLAGPKRVLRTAKLTHLLGSLDPAANPLPAWVFEDQLWVRPEVRRYGTWVPCGKMVKLTVAPYAVWSATTNEPSCVPGDWVNCYTGPEGTIGKGPCKAGTRRCPPSGRFADAGCMGQVVPQEGEVCNGLDDDCDVAVDEDAIDCPPESVCVHATCMWIEVDCLDGIDNDGDLFVDCADADCAGRPDCMP